MENKSHNLEYCSSHQPVVVYNFRQIENTFSVLLLQLHGQLLIALWHGIHLFDNEMQIQLSTKDFLICLFFFYTCCNLSAVQNILPRQQIFSILNVFLHFLHQFVWKHFRIFVTVMRSKFPFLL